MEFNSSKVTPIALAVGLMASSSSFAATVWAPTDGDVNIMGTDDGTLAIFDDSDFSLTGDMLTLNSYDLVDFIPSGSDYILSNMAGDNMTLSGSNMFRLGFLADGASNWTSDVAWDSFGNNAYDVLFGSSPTPAAGSANIIDVAASSVAPPQAVPLPAPLALFASGLLGMVSVSRRRKSKG